MAPKKQAAASGGEDGVTAEQQASQDESKRLKELALDTGVRLGRPVTLTTWVTLQGPTPDKVST